MNKMSPAIGSLPITVSRGAHTLQVIAAQINKRAVVLDSAVGDATRSISAVDVAIGNGKRILRILKKMREKTRKATQVKSPGKLRTLDKEYQQDKTLIDELARKAALGGINLLKKGLFTLAVGRNESVKFSSSGASVKDLGIDQDSLEDMSQIPLARENLQINAIPRVRAALLRLGEAEKELQAKKFFAQVKLNSLHSSNQALGYIHPVAGKEVDRSANSRF